MRFEGRLSEKRSPEPQVETVSQLFLIHAQDPRNMGELTSANGLAVGVGSCGDTLAVQLRVGNGMIEDIKCLPHGCLYTVVCASVMSETVKGRHLDDALKLQPEDIDNALGGLPSDHQHCARLAVNSLGEAIEDYYRRNGFPEETIMTPKILIATQDRDRFSSLSGSLEALINADIYWTATGNDTIAESRRLAPLLVVMDETLPDMDSLGLTRELLKHNALINTAVVTRLSEEDFHEASEGLGVLMPLPPFPGKKEAVDIVSGLKRIFALPAR